MLVLPVPSMCSLNCSLYLTVANVFICCRWVFECARRGEKVAEAEFLVDKANNVKETTDIEAVDLHQEDNKLLKKEGVSSIT